MPRRVLQFIAAVWLGMASADAQLTVIDHIKHLTPDEAAKGPAVEVEAQVVHLHPRRVGIFLFDGRLGIFVYLPEVASRYENLRVGSIVRIKGTATPGGFAPDIRATEVEVVGWSPVPEPRKFFEFEVYLPNLNLDCEWVKVWGRLVGASVLEDFNRILLELEIHEGKCSIQLPYTPDGMDRAAALMYQRVEFPAVAGTVFNRHRQMTGRTFYVNSFDDFTVYLEDFQQQDWDVRPIEQLLWAGANFQKALHTRGTVAQVGRNEVYLRGDQMSLKAVMVDSTRLQPGDHVDLFGFIWPQPISPAFRARTAKVIEKRDPPEALAIDLSGPLDPDWNYALVETETILVDIGQSFDMSPFASGTVYGPANSGRIGMVCRSGGRVFDVRLPEGFAGGGDLKPGAHLRLTAICNLMANRDPRWSHFVDGVWLEVLQPGGIEVVMPAPWWTVRRLVWAAGMALGALLFSFLWNLMLHKTVARQTETIGKQIEHESVLHERQRIARELHDTLEQGLAGMALQLQSSAKQLEIDPNRGKEALRLAQGMLKHCRYESRNSILDLRGGLLEKMDLPAALRESIRPLAEECGAELEVEVAGVPRRLRQFAERQLLHIAKEAATNAARHATPHRIRVEIEYLPGALRLEVVDDGTGFAVDRLAKAERFGLQGMRERANRLHGMLGIESSIGAGTTIRVDLASTEEWELEG